MASFQDYKNILTRRPAPKTVDPQSTLLEQSNDLGNSDDLEDSDLPQTGHVPELIDLTEEPRPGGEHPVLTITSHFNRPRERIHDRHSEIALHVVRKLNKDGDTISVHLAVYSPHIQQALRSELTDYDFLNLAADPIIIPKPFAPLFHRKKQLREYTNNLAEGSEERTHMDVLMGQFYNEYMKKAETIFANEVQAGKKVRFEYLWTLFPGEAEVLVEHPHYQEVQRVVHCQQFDGETPSCTIHTWRWGYNAGKFGPCKEAINIADFSGTKHVSRLPCYPLEFMADKEREELRSRLINRGRKWKELIGPRHQEYNGLIWTNRKSDTDVRNISELELCSISGRIMLDSDMFTQSYGRLADHLIGVTGYELPSEPKRRDSDDWYLPSRRRRELETQKVPFTQAKCSPVETYEMSDDEALLCPARAKGFSLVDKAFALFMVEDISEIEFATDAFDSLCMHPRLKTTIEALVEAHASRASKFDDLVPGKGRGVVISLEGPPGSGKTLTAESISELTRRPLYSISTGDLGVDAHDAESNLREVFRRAEEWNAVVLLDEAELFLTKRTLEDLERNALVTVFLRTLEYFQGVIFLTSNMVSSFDPAFNSRIHLHVPYVEPDEETREAIWKRFLPQDTSPEMVTKLSKLKVNGREIKNLVRTASLLASHNNRDITEEDITKIYEWNHAPNVSTITAS